MSIRNGSRQSPRSDSRLLCLFPDLEQTGGIQTSGKIAREALAATWSERAYFFGYGKVPSALGAHSPRSVHASSRVQAVLAAGRVRWLVDSVLVWHIGLLKLLPFLRVRSARVALCLLGIEAWRRQDPLTQLLLARVHLFLPISEYTWRRFAAANSTHAATPHRTIHLGLGAALAGRTPPAGDPPVALVLSRLAKSERYKGHRELIEAWRLVLDRTPNAKLWIAGDGDLRAELQALAVKSGVAHAVKFWGWVSEATKEELLAHCRCLAMPSRKEGFGLVYLEAMRLGRPCLVSTSDAGREVINPPEAGLAIDRTQPAELADAVCRLLTPGPAWDAWSRQARARYESRFTARHFQDRLIDAIACLEGQPKS